MKREIKFRQWVKEVRDGDTVLPGYMDYDPVWQDIKAVRVEKRDVETSMMVDVVKSHVANVNDLFKGESRLMQFTGLHDKNSKEIYEGDVVDYPFCTGEQRRRVVEWTDWGTGYEPFTICGKCGDVPQERDVEVIGNRFENPELLNNE